MRSTEPPAELARFPQTLWVAGQRASRVYRHRDPVTGSPRAPLFFASGTGAAHEGRWDLPAPEGACYLADDVSVCVLEVLAEDLHPDGPPRLASQRWLQQRRQVTVTARADSGPYADLDADAAFGFGVAGDLHTTDDRSLTQRWASTFRRHGFGGLRGHARTPPAGDAGTWTLFGPGGTAAAPPDQALELGAPAPLHNDPVLLNRLRGHGIEFLPVPHDVGAD